MENNTIIATDIESTKMLSFNYTINAASSINWSTLIRKHKGDLKHMWIIKLKCIN